MESRVCRLYAENDLRIETDIVREPGQGEVLVRLNRGGICGSDLHYYREGGFGPVRVREPIILGHELAGVIEEIGLGVEGLGLHDRVAINPSHPCMSCEYCAAGQFQHCLKMCFLGSAMRFPHEQGGFRDFLTIQASQCYKARLDTSLAGLACAEPLAVCLHGAHQAGNLTGKKVLVSGSGPIGVLTVAVARRAGAREIVVTDLYDYPLNIAKQMGATSTLNIRDNLDSMEAYFVGKGYFDVIFECSAASSAIEKAFKAIKPQGSIVQLGITGTVEIPLNLLVGKEVLICGSQRFHPEFSQAVDLISEGKIDVTPIVTDTYPLENVLEALAISTDRSRSVKVQLSFA